LIEYRIAPIRLHRLRRVSCAATKNALAGRARAFSLLEQVKRPADQGRVWKFVETCNNREIFIQKASRDESRLRVFSLATSIADFI
jgi:hypothetical protein